MHSYLQRCRVWALLVWSLLAWNVEASAQVPLPYLGYNRTFAHFGSEEGLKDGTVYAVLQDRTGFVWIGTESGLLRYDGHRLTPFLKDPNDPEVLSPGVSDLLESQDGSLWIATWGAGLIRRNPDDGSLTHFPPAPAQDGPSPAGHLTDGRIQTLFEDHLGSIWVGTFTEGLARLDPGATNFTFYRHDPQDSHSLPDDRIWALGENSDGTLWVGTHRGLASLDPERQKLTRWQHDPQDPTSLPTNNIRSLLVDRQGTLWVGTRRGLVCFKDGEFHRFPINHSGEDNFDIINTLLEDRRGGLWIGNQGGGLNYLDPTRKHFDHFINDPMDPNSLRHNDVRALMEDRHRNLWVGTRGGGVDRLNLKRGEVFHLNFQLEDPNSLSDPMVRELARDHQGRLWVVTPRGLDRYEPRSGTFHHFRHDPSDPRSLRYTDSNNILVSASGDLWVASFDSLSRFLDDERGFEHFSFRTDSNSPQAWVFAFAETQGALWLGTIRGLQRFDLQDHEFSEVHLTPLGQTPWIASLAEAQDGRLWIATQRGAVLLLDPRSGSTELYREPTEEPIYTLQVAQDGKLWIALRGALEELDPADGIRRHSNDELTDMEVVGLLEESDQHLWLNTGLGAWRFDRLRGTFHRIVGGPPVNRYSRASLVDDGGFTVGSNNGLYVFAPQNFVTVSEAPTVVLTGFERSGQTVDLGAPLDQIQEVELTTEDEAISFRFNALEFTQGVVNRYRYRLQAEGESSSWVELGPEGVVRINALEAGEHLFQAQALGSNSQWNGAGLRILLHKPPPWWQTPWFRALASSLALALLFTLYRWRRLDLQARERRLNERIAEAVADLERSEARYRALFERNLAGVVRADLEGRVLVCNDAFAQIFSYPDATTCQRELVLDFDHGDGRLRRQLETTGQVAGYEWTLTTPDDRKLVLLWSAILTHRRNGEPLIEGTVIDLSARRRAEERLGQARKMESLGLLAGGIAHDFNNLLTGVLGQTELARQNATQGSRLSTRLNRIENAAEKAANLARQMLAYAGRAEAALVPVNLNRLIQGSRHLLQEIAGHRAEVRLRLAGELPKVEADTGQMTQVLLNLMRNAVEAISDSNAGTIIITTGITELEAKDVRRLILGENLAPGRHVFLQVSDTGHGMEDETRARIFDPFFSTRFTGRGLGLAMVFGIVKGHLGAIEVESKHGRGTRLRILLPAVGAVPSGTEELEPWADEAFLQAARESSSVN